MAFGSRLAAIEQAIKTVLTAQPGLAGVQVERGHPAKLLERESVWLDRVRFLEQAKALKAGQNPRRQAITAELIIRVSQEGDDVDALKDRAYLLADEVEEALRSNINLSGAADFGGVEAGEADSFTDTDGRVCAIRLDATYTATKG